MYRSHCILPAVGVVLFASLSHGQTWSGAVSGSWNAAGNWSPAGVPASATSTQLVFGATANGAMTNDIPAPPLGIFTLNQMTFTAAASAYSLTGDSLSFTSASGPVAPAIVMNSANAVSIADSISLNSNFTVSGAGTGTIALNGAIGGIFNLTVAGSDTLALTGTNTYSGTTAVDQSGTLAISSIANGGVAGPLGAASNGVSKLTLGDATPSRGNLLLTGTNATYSTDRGVTVAGLYPSVAGGAIGVQNAGTTLTWNGQITGSGSFIKNGAGTLVLTNTSNNFTGGAYIEAGTLAVGAAGAVIPSGSTVTALTGGTFQVGAAAGDNSAAALAVVNINSGGTLQSAAGSGNYYLSEVNITGGTFDFSASTNFALHFTGVAAITINPGTNTWIGGGTSHIQNDTTASISISTISGATLSAGIILSNAGTNPNFTLTGGGSVRLANTGNTANITASGTNVFSSDLSTDVGSGAFGTLGTGSFTLTNRAFLNYDGMSATSAKPLTVANGSIAVINPGANLTLSGVISNSDPTAFVEALGPVYANVGGTGTLTLTANNTYGGPTYVSDGAILAIPTIGNAGSASPLGTSSNAPGNLNLGQASLVGGRGDLLVTGTAAAYSTDRGATINGFYGFGTGGGAIGVQNAGTTLTWNGQITGPGEFIKSAAGTLVLTNTANNWQGGTVVEAGQLVISGPNGVGILPTGSGAAILAGAELNFAAFIDASQTASAQSTFFVEGGTLRLSGNAVRLFLNQLWCYTGSTVDLTPPPSSQLRLDFVNAAPLINVLGNSTWIGPNSYMLNSSGVQLPITIAPNVTLTSSIDLASNGTSPTNLYPFLINGGGTLYLTGAGVDTAMVTVGQARFRVDSFTPLQSTYLTLDGGTLQYSGPTQSTDYPFALGPGGGTVEVSNAATTLTLTGTIGPATGVLPGPFTKAGPGVLDLTYTGNQFLGGVVVSAGRLEISDDAQLGLATVTVNPPAILAYTASTTTSRTFNLAGGTLEAAAGATVTYSGATINGGYLRGAGTHVFTGGTALYGTSTFNSTTLSVTGAASFTNFSNGGTLTVAAAVATPISLNGFTNQGSGTITVGAGSQINAADFQSYGVMTLTPAAGSNFTEVMNTGSSALFFNGGSQTFIGSATAPNPKVVGVDLGGQNLVLAGALFVNNGLMFNSTGGGSIVVEYGATYKGAGSTNVPIVTQNGGKVLFGNCPGVATFGSLVVGTGGINNLEWEINDAGPSASYPHAPGVAGPTANAANRVSGWSMGLVASQTPRAGAPAYGNLTWTATNSSPFSLDLETLLGSSTLSGTNPDGPMADFDPTQSYSWPIITYQGTYSGPTSDAQLTADTLFDTSLFANALRADAEFSLHVDQYPSGGGELDLIYSPSAVPEPGTLALSGIAAIGWVTSWRRRWCSERSAA